MTGATPDGETIENVIEEGGGTAIGTVTDCGTTSPVPQVQKRVGVGLGRLAHDPPRTSPVLLLEVTFAVAHRLPGTKRPSLPKARQHLRGTLPFRKCLILNPKRAKTLKIPTTR